MEFKVFQRLKGQGFGTVDIETEWNLKIMTRQLKSVTSTVDIETEWNLKWKRRTADKLWSRVDIETEWNLKERNSVFAEYDRIRRYRNRVEFKGIFADISEESKMVDIETEWNLKIKAIGRQKMINT